MLGIALVIGAIQRSDKAVHDFVPELDGVVVWKIQSVSPVQILAIFGPVVDLAREDVCLVETMSEKFKIMYAQLPGFVLHLFTIMANFRAGAGAGET